jgi:hypothetical protein
MTYRPATARRTRLIAVVLVAVWAPYMSLRCVDVPEGHSYCPFSTNAEAAGGGHDHHRSVPPAHEHSNQTSRSSPGHDFPAGRTCCELAGKYHLLASAGAPSFDHPIVLALLPATWPEPSIPAAPVAASGSFGSVHAHDPPPYLLHAALLI